MRDVMAVVAVVVAVVVVAVMAVRPSDTDATSDIAATVYWLVGGCQDSQGGSDEAIRQTTYMFARGAMALPNSPADSGHPDAPVRIKELVAETLADTAGTHDRGAVVIVRAHEYHYHSTEGHEVVFRARCPLPEIAEGDLLWIAPVDGQ